MSERSKRQSFLGPDSDAVLAGTRAGIIGLCGGGSHIAQQLAHVGVGEYVPADFDQVEHSNRNRMIGSRPRDADWSLKKTAVISRTIKAIAPRAKIHVLEGHWEDHAEHLRDCTAVFGCVDSFNARSELESYCRRYMLPLIDVGMDVREFEGEHFITGQVITSLPGGPCMRCLGILTDDLLAEEATKYGAAGGRPQVAWPNGVLASIAVGQFMRLVTPWHGLPLHPYLEYDGNRQLVTPSAREPITADRLCPHFPTDQVGDPFWRGPPPSKLMTLTRRLLRLR